MSKDTTQLESELQQMRANPLDPALLDRLDACADESWSSLHPNEQQLENDLRQIAPAPLSKSVMNAMLKATDGLPFESDARLVPFPNAPSERTTSGRPWWSTATAAAVALIGIATALLIPLDQPEPPLSSISPDASAPAPLPLRATDGVVPAEFSSKLSKASDEGILWNNDQQPHRVVKVVYQDRVTLKRGDGSTYEVEQPRVEYYVVPTHSH